VQVSSRTYIYIQTPQMQASTKGHSARRPKCLSIPAALCLLFSTIWRPRYNCGRSHVRARPVAFKIRSGIAFKFKTDSLDVAQSCMGLLLRRQASSKEGSSSWRYENVKKSFIKVNSKKGWMYNITTLK
jgi:hypothetical protein